tara:strand:+ start:216 stop:815 length:600 start_codon:yes stop_codon:yes gene_type:complete
MKIYEMEQRTPEWFAIRVGVISGSNVMRLITKTGKPCAQANAYINQLVSEKLEGKIQESYVSAPMQRGIDLEPEALAYYMMETGHAMKNVGFIKHDDYEIGCSPDGLGEDRGVEIKCPLPHNHVDYLRHGMPDKYYGQVQLAMWLTGLKLWDFVSYSDTIKPFIVTIPFDEVWVSKMLDIILPTHDLIEELHSQYKIGA